MTDFSLRFIDETDGAREAAIDDCFHLVCKDEELARRTLQPLLRHSDPDVRYCAVVVILKLIGQRVNSDYAIHDLFNILTNLSESQSTRAIAAEALGEYGSPSVVERLGAIYNQSNDQYIKAIVISALRRVRKDKEASIVAARILLRIIDQADNESKRSAVESLELLGPLVAADVESAYETLRLESKCRVLRVLLKWQRVSSDAASTLLVQGLRCNCNETKEIAASCAQYVPHPSRELIEELGRSLESSVASVRQQSSLSLLCLRHSTHFHLLAPVIINALSDPDDEVRRNVATAVPALGEQGSKAAHLLVPLLVDPCEEVRVAAVGSLVEMGRKAMGAVPKLLELRISLLTDPALLVEVDLDPALIEEIIQAIIDKPRGDKLRKYLIDD